MPFEAVTFWSDGLYRCVLRRSDARFELLLYCEGRAFRFETCDSEAEARTKAHEWLQLLPKLTSH